MGLVINILLWLLLIAIAAVATLLVGLYIRGAFRWRPLFYVRQAIAPQHPQFPLILKSLTESLATHGQVVDFWDTAAEIQQARIEAIRRARHSIQFETFMMTPGKRTNDFAEEIARKAIEGVSVQLLVDTFGTRSLPRRYWQHLRSAGVQIVFFNPFDWRAPANFAGRTHRKLLIIDNEQALIGGSGISDLWDGIEKSDDTKPWLDIEMMLVGEVVSVLSATFQLHWQGHRIKREDEKTGKLEPGVTIINMDRICPVVDADPLPSTKRLSNDKKESSTILVTPGTKPNYRDSSVEVLKQTLVACAQKRVWLSSPYFLPNKSTRQILITAKKAGVDVRILTTSDRSDKKPVYYASYEVYGSLLRAGIKIFEYQPSMLHAKMLLLDNHWANTGSTNIDYRSFLHNDELDIVTDSALLIEKIEQAFEKGFAQSKQISLRQWRNRSLLKHRVLGNVVRLVEWQL
ncbi:Phospholipase D active site motif domain protein [Synechococcus sp. PCC 7335]|uniref:phospholipase D-like domain-containing protein n=1 Tax=Synechococcus sp. (strain ATCC 29403 / PCC 7335) TaxID=91464 RepID=UPI00017ED258|nr:phosphatidylserine/phosphatidylglycerophosphate/cardiolipin synthase family protein [Synechococcus sp. PCC 7335]EDX87032.1 Phospholipase D active site motif domain protein [Synechococcus sp. PCC 7335]